MTGRYHQKKEDTASVCGSLAADCRKAAIEDREEQNMRESFSEILAEARRASSDALQISAGSMRIDIRDVSFENSRKCLEFTMETDFIMPHEIYTSML